MIEPFFPISSYRASISEETQKKNIFRLDLPEPNPAGSEDAHDFHLLTWDSISTQKKTFSVFRSLTIALKEQYVEHYLYFSTISIQQRWVGNGSGNMSVFIVSTVCATVCKRINEKIVVVKWCIN